MAAWRKKKSVPKQSAKKARVSGNFRYNSNLSKNLPRAPLAAARRMELKWHEQSVSEVFDGTDLSFIQIRPCKEIPRGDGPSERVGQVIYPTKLEARMDFRGYEYATDNTNTGPAHVRVVVVRDKQTNGTLPAAGAIFNGVTVASGGVPPSLAFPKVQTRKRFDILYDQDVYLPAAGGSGSTQLPPNKIHTLAVNLNGQIDYTDGGDTGAIAEITSTNYYILVGFSWSSPAVTSYSWECAAVTRLYYTD